MASSRLLSSSVSWPSICKCTRRSSACVRSRTSRGIFENTLETGCIRAFITDSRRSAVTMSRRRESSVMLGSAAVACSTWLRVSTSSPTRFIMRFSRATSTRNVLSEAVPCARDFEASAGVRASASATTSARFRRLHRFGSARRSGRPGQAFASCRFRRRGGHAGLDWIRFVRGLCDLRALAFTSGCRSLQFS